MQSARTLLAVALILVSAAGAAAQPPAPLPGQPYAQQTPVYNQQTPAYQQPGQLGQPAPAPVGPPFRLSEVEQQFVDQILLMWEDKSDEVKTFTCEFERWEYDSVFGPGSETPLFKSTGRLSYQKPDKGSFKIEKVRKWQGNADTGQGDWEPLENKIGEHWVCDGKAVYMYNHEEKQLEVQPLPPELQGTAIVDGPLPFLFGAEADKLRRRYWIRSTQSNAESIFLQAYPRRQEDAANYHHVDIKLNRKTMLPEGIQVWMPNSQSRAVYIFQQPSVNDKLEQFFSQVFKTPHTPLGWKKVVLDPPPSVPQAAAPQDTTTR